MGAYEPYVHEFRCEFNCNNKPVIVSSDIENIMLITDIIH